MKTRKLFILFILLSAFNSNAQYILNGSATKNNCNCYTLTQAVNAQSGSVWNSNKISLDSSFDFHFNVFLGCNISGADGIVFVLQPISTSIGTSGGGMGFQGIAPSVGISLDTYQNAAPNFPGVNDPPFDHICIQSNGYNNHDGNNNNLTPPVQASATNSNIKDCQWHVLRITWDAVNHWLRAYFDDSLRVQVQNDIVANIFFNNPMVYWGFTGATGGENNLQQFCTSLNPNFSTNLSDNYTCVGTPVIFQDNSQSFTVIQSFYWDFGDGTTSNVQTPPPHNYSTGTYTVKHVITGMDGCISDTFKQTVNIGAFPVADFNVYDTCSGDSVRIVNKSTCSFGNLSNWNWLLDGNLISNSPQPALTNLSVGLHQLQLIVSSEFGCTSDTATKYFIIKNTPVISASGNNGCFNDPIQFNAMQTDTSTVIQQWNWNFGDGQSGFQQNPVHIFSSGGVYNVTVSAIATDGCVTTSNQMPVNINRISVNAGSDTIAIKNIPFIVNASVSAALNEPLNYTWSPITGLSDPAILQPTATLQNDIIFTLTVTSPEGCTANSSVKIIVYNNTAIYVPSGFTPNHDGLNDILRPKYIGITKLYYFAVYDRWGQIVFKTSDMSKGWDGTVNGADQNTGTFVWIIQAEDLTGKMFQLKGFTTLIR